MGRVRPACDLARRMTVSFFESTFGSRLANGSYVSGHLVGQTQTQNNISNI